jgi:hypothetical protein
VHTAQSSGGRRTAASFVRRSHTPSLAMIKNSSSAETLCSRSSGSASMSPFIRLLPNARVTARTPSTRGMSSCVILPPLSCKHATLKTLSDPSCRRAGNVKCIEQNTLQTDLVQEKVDCVRQGERPQYLEDVTVDQH